MNGRLRRSQSSLPDVYFEGFLEKRSFRDKASLKRWTVLSGNTLFFYHSSKDTDYVEQMDLVDLQSVTDDPTPDSNLEQAKFNIRLKDKTVKFTAPSLEARELWKGYAHAVVKLSLPSDLVLLPGQIQDLLGAVEQERERRKRPPPLSPPPPPPQHPPPHPPPLLEAGPLPKCYVQVNRVQAEMLLEREEGRGNLLLRPGGHGNTFTMTTREVHICSIFKHYRVTETPGEGFLIDLKEPIACSTLDDVISAMVERTGGGLTPFVPNDKDKIYEDKISFFLPDEENGEKTVVYPPTPPPKPPPKPAPSSPAPKKQDDPLAESEREHSRIPVRGPKWGVNAVKNSLLFIRPVNAPPPLPDPSGVRGPKRRGNAKNSLPFIRPVIAHPHLPDDWSGAAAPSVVTLEPRPRVPLMPPTPMKRDSPSDHGDPVCLPVCPSSHPTLVSPEPGQGAPVRTQKPVPAPRGRPALYSIPVRSASDVSALSAELKEAFRRIKTRE